MAGHARYTALLDMCVLYPLAMTDALMSLDPVNAIAAFKRMRSRRKKPQSSPEDFAYALEIGGLPTTAERLRLAVELIQSTEIYFAIHPKFTLVLPEDLGVCRLVKPSQDLYL